MAMNEGGTQGPNKRSRRTGQNIRAPGFAIHLGEQAHEATDMPYQTQHTSVDGNGTNCRTRIGDAERRRLGQGAAGRVATRFAAATPMQANGESRHIGVGTPAENPARQYSRRSKERNVC
jgi:hypothetical protein